MHCLVRVHCLFCFVLFCLFLFFFFSVFFLFVWFWGRGRGGDAAERAVLWRAQRWRAAAPQRSSSQTSPLLSPLFFFSFFFCFSLFFLLPASVREKTLALCVSLLDQEGRTVFSAFGRLLSALHFFFFFFFFVFCAFF